MSQAPTHTPLVRVADRPEEERFAHPLNPESEMHGFSLSEAAGLTRVGLHMIRIPPGKGSNAYHTHACEEEFFYIVSGRGIAEIDDVEHEVGPGDFLGFTAPSVGHYLRNPFDEDLVYLVGGERREMEYATFPRLGKVLVRHGGQVRMFDESNVEAF